MTTTNNNLMAGREIGPAGTVSRLVVGAAAIAIPVALEGIGWWDVAALLAAPLVAIAAARLVEAALGPSTPRAICSAQGCVLTGILFAAAFGLGGTTAVDGDVVFWGFLGASMLLAAARGDGGCELLAFPNAITGRRDRIGCIVFTPIDTLEARHRQQPA
jgi:hypothetical protein